MFSNVFAFLCGSGGREGERRERDRDMCMACFYRDNVLAFWREKRRKRR